MSEEIKTKSNKLRNGCFGIVGFVVLLIVIGAVFGDGDSSEEKAAGVAASSEPIKEVSARELFSSFEANEVAAKQAYGGRPLKVSGTITGITLDLMDKPVIQLDSGNEFLPVQAGISDPAIAATLSKGNSVTVICEGLTEVIGAPILSDCEISQ